jgi:glycosyltransferase involved in cell wall biosynthesis
MKLTLAITTYNRYDMLLESFSQVIDDPRIDEILIMDDCSKDEYWNKIKELPALSPKIKVVRQLENRGMSINKYHAVFNSKNDWVILFDSDNIIEKVYMDSIPEILIPKIIYCPSFSRPHFDYRKFQSKLYSIDPDLEGSSRIDSDPMFWCLMNTCNFLVHRDSYLKVWKENKEMIASDSIWFNYLWLKEGNGLCVVRGMEYFHRVHEKSGFSEKMEYNISKAEEVKKKILSL